MKHEIKEHFTLFIRKFLQILIRPFWHVSCVDTAAAFLALPILIIEGRRVTVVVAAEQFAP
jgi:hypothetical protein